jgi:peroxiredoxin
MVRTLTAVALTLALASSSALAADKLKIGGECPNFTGLEGTDGKSYSLDNFKDKDVLVIAVTCNHCPVAVAYEDRLIAFTKQYCGPDAKAAFFAVNVNNVEQDKLDKMKERAKEKGFNFCYAYDPSQKLAKDLGATRTPEFYVFNKARKLIYHGAMDDSMNAGSVKTNYLAEAVDASLKGAEPKVSETQARGCGIMFERNR